MCIRDSNTIFFIPKTKAPKGRIVTCARFVCDVRPHKEEIHRTRLTVGGNLISYPGDVSTRTADLPLVKIFINHVLSTPRAKFIAMDVGNFYLNTPMERHQCMRVHHSQIPDETMDECNLPASQDDGWVHSEVQKGMCGLPQAGMLANKLLAKFGHHQTPHTNGKVRAHESAPLTNP